MFQIIDLSRNNESHVQEAAALLVAGFAEHWPDAWPTLDEALNDVRELLADDAYICRAAVAEDGTLLGWIGGLYEYALVWELHPLVVRNDQQGRGIGRALVADLETQVAARGGMTIRLGSDDQDDMTTLSGVDLYDNLPERLATIRNLKGHPYSFYEKCGYTIVGVIPDANGYGKPDITMAKRIRQP